MKTVVSICALALLVVWCVIGPVEPVAASDWITEPSYFTHDPTTGQRVQQYSPIGPFYTYSRGDFRRSGYRQTRSSIQVGGSADHMHIVEEWGNPVRPYGEWRFPYRPYSVPYDAWGPPVPFVNNSFGGNQFGGNGVGRSPGYAGYGAAPTGGAAPGGYGAHNPATQQRHANPGYRPQPWHDGRYAPYDSRGPHGYPDLRHPPRREPIQIGDPVAP